MLGKVCLKRLRFVLYAVLFFLLTLDITNRTGDGLIATVCIWLALPLAFIAMVWWIYACVRDTVRLLRDGVAPEDAPTWAEYAVWWVQDELAEIAALDGRGKARAARRGQQAGYGKQAFVRHILATYSKHAPFAILRAAVQAVFRPGAARGNFALPLLRQVQKTAVQRDIPFGCALAKLV